jgi:hypothetical protein
MTDKTIDEQIAEKASKLAYHYQRISVLTQELEALKNIQSYKQEDNKQDPFNNMYKL